MEQIKYRLKRDLPDCKAGAIFISNGTMYYCMINANLWQTKYPKEYVENNPEWFEKIDEKDLVKKYTIQDMKDAYNQGVTDLINTYQNSFTKNNIVYSFDKFIKTLDEQSNP